MIELPFHPRHVLFDLDGTLANSSSLHARAFTAVLTAHAPELLFRFDYERVRGWPTRKVFLDLGITEPAALSAATELKQLNYRAATDSRRQSSPNGRSADAGALPAKRGLRHTPRHRQQPGLGRSGARFCRPRIPLRHDSDGRRCSRRQARAGQLYCLPRTDCSRSGRVPCRRGCAEWRPRLTRSRHRYRRCLRSCRVPAMANFWLPDLEALHRALCPDWRESRRRETLCSNSCRRSRVAAWSGAAQILVPLVSPLTIWNVLQGRLQPFVDHIHVVVSPAGLPLFEAELAGVAGGPEVSVSVQPEPRGMGDAIFRGLPIWGGAEIF